MSLVDDLDRHFGDPVAFDHVAAITAEVPVRVPLVADVDFRVVSAIAVYGRKKRGLDDRHAVEERRLEYVDRRAEDGLARRDALMAWPQVAKPLMKLVDTTSRSGSPPFWRAAWSVSRIRSVEP